MFCLGRAEFPVDTHVWRISKDMGWVPKSFGREDTYTHMNSMVPDKIKYDLHILLVTHGKRCFRCAKNGNNRKPADGDWCPLKCKDWNSRVAAEESCLKQDTPEACQGTAKIKNEGVISNTFQIHSVGTKVEYVE